MNPIYVGRFAQRLNPRGQLRFPIRWRFGESQSWMILPLELLEGGKADFPYLRLQPVYEDTPARILEILKIPPPQPPTLNAAIEALRVVARGRGIDPLVVSHAQTDTHSIHIQLSEAQLTWLSICNRSLMLTGVMTSIQIWAAEEFGRWEQQDSSESFAELVKRTPPDS